MKRTFKYALAAVLGATMVAPAMAQDQFPDVPASHWAYKELLELKSAGLLVGYPDGLFRGGRPASRYELAVAIHAVWMNLKGQQDALKAQIDDLSKRMDGMASKADLDALKAQIDALQAEVGRIKSEDIAKLNRLTDEFRAELNKMGANVDEIKKGLAALEGRVSAIEKRLPSFDVTGTYDMVGLGGYGTSHRFGATRDDRPTGVGRNFGFGGQSVVGVNKDLTALYHSSLTLTSHDAPEANFHWKTSIGFTNMFGYNTRIPFGFTSQFSPFGSQSTTIPGVPFQEGDMDIYFQEFNAWWDFSLAGAKGTFKMGRQGHQAGMYFFRRPDTTYYFSNEYWDNGDWMFDGGNLGLKWGSTSLNIFGGRKSGETSMNGIEIQPMDAGSLFGPRFFAQADRPRGLNQGDISIDQLLGTNLKIGLGSKAAINLVYIMLDSNTVINLGTTLSPDLINGVRVWGGNVRYDASNFHFGADYSKSDIMYNQSKVLGDRNAAIDLRARYEAGDKWGIGAGYRKIEPNFAAPGSWGRIGMWWNPTNIEGFWVNGHLNLGKAMIDGGAGFYKGVNGLFGGMTPDDKVSRFTVNVTYPICKKTDLIAGWERVNWDFAARSQSKFDGSKPYEQWFNLGAKWTLSNNAWMKMGWEMSDIDGKDVFSAFPSGFFGPRATGGLLTFQFGGKF